MHYKKEVFILSIVQPFKALRPRLDLATQIATLPYDVMNRQEAKEMATANPQSFLHISRSEIDLPESLDDHDPLVYQKAQENLAKFLANGWLFQDEEPYFYIYRLTMSGRSQTGLVACTSVDEYLNGQIKKHEYTRPVKEQDRIDHFSACDCHTEGVFLTYPNQEKITGILEQWCVAHQAAYDFTANDGIGHQFWVIDDQHTITMLSDLFGQVESLYIADGHHRSASAAKVCQIKRATSPNYQGDEPFNFFLSVIFPDDQLQIMDYNRVVTDLNGLTEAEFLACLSENYTIEATEGAYKPQAPHTFGLFLTDKWYKLTAKPAICPADVIDGLDASILQNSILGPILGITDPRKDTRIDFVGGIRGLEALEKRCHTDMTLAFSCYPTAIRQVFAVADSNQVMPAKSTWFEPKLRSGLFLHDLT